METKKYICECGKQFECVGSLRSHKVRCKIHLEVKQQKQEQELACRRLPNGLFKCENPKCGKEHDGSYGSGHFCCKKCAQQYNGITAYNSSMQNHSKKNNLAEYILKRKSPYGTWCCKYCNKVFETRSEYQKHLQLIHPIKSCKGGWNKGETKETNASVAKGAAKQKQLYENGTLHIWCEGKHLKKAIREKISMSRLKNIEEHGGFSHIGWYKVKNLDGVEYTVRGTWELNVAKRLSELGYHWIKKIHISYTTDIQRNYFPDFYIPSIDSYVEVKGFYSELDQRKMKAVLATNPGIKIFFISENVYYDFIEKRVNLDNSLLLNESTCQNSYGTLS